MTDASDLLPGLEERVYEHRGARIRAFVGGDGPPPRPAGARSLVAAPGLRGFADALAPLLDGPVDVLGHSRCSRLLRRIVEFFG